MAPFLPPPNNFRFIILHMVYLKYEISSNLKQIQVKGVVVVFYDVTLVLFWGRERMHVGGNAVFVVANTIKHD